MNQGIRLPLTVGAGFLALLASLMWLFRDVFLSVFAVLKAVH
jgi:hypothetical protein